MKREWAAETRDEECWREKEERKKEKKVRGGFRSFYVRLEWVIKRLAVQKTSEEKQVFHRRSKEEVCSER